MCLSLSGFISRSVISLGSSTKDFLLRNPSPLGFPKPIEYSTVCADTRPHTGHIFLIHSSTNGPIGGSLQRHFFSGFEAGARPPCLQAPRGAGDSEARRGCLLLQLARRVGSKPAQPSVVSRLARPLLGIGSGEGRFRKAASHFSDERTLVPETICSSPRLRFGPWENCPLECPSG